MEIGQGLKKIRKNLNLSQTEMAGDVLTKSYYSKIERGIHEINASDLIQILQLHHVDINDFFASLGVKNTGINKEKWIAKIRQAYYNQDLAQIRKLKKELAEVKADNYTHRVLEAIASVVELEVNRGKKDLPVDQKDHIKALIFETDNWNKDSLELFSLSFSFWKVEERAEIVRSILKKYDNIQSCSQRIQNLVSAILVNYLAYSIRNHVIDDTETIQKIFTLLKKLPEIPDNCFAKVMKNFYQAYFTGDNEKIQSIITFFRSNDMNEIAEVLKVSI